MKQETVRDCVAAVAAMATGTTLAEFKAEIPETAEGGYRDIDFLVYCARRGVMAGGVNYPCDRDVISAALEQGWVGVPMDLPAFMGVRAERLKGKGHAIYWDGKQVWDPNPCVPDGRPLASYKIDMWWPLCRGRDATESAEYSMKRLAEIINHIS